MTRHEHRMIFTTHKDAAESLRRHLDFLGPNLRPDVEASPLHPYQTHWRNDQDGGHYYGHYFKTLEEAREDYEARCKRGY